jgi:filamentous hemagglutinin family protein
VPLFSIFRQLGLSSLFVFLGLHHTCSAIAQITPDSTLGTEASTVTSTTINGLPSELVEGGAMRGLNLFHSFLDFNVSQGRGAFFSNPIGISNILTRITGSQASTINGTLGVLGNANLFLLNPNGIIFGSSAQLNLNGSMLATTASELQFGNQGSFSAISPSAPGVLTVNPSALLFNQITTQGISSQANLSVPGDRSLLLIGGPINLNESSLLAPDGAVGLGAFTGVGSVGLNTSGNIVTLESSNSLQRANIQLSNSTIDVGGFRGGDVTVYAQNLDISRSNIVTRTASLQSGKISLHATDTIGLRNQSSISARSLSLGRAGDIFIQARQLSLQDQSLIVAPPAFGITQGGDIIIQASNSVQLSGASSIATGNLTSGGAAGSISITTPRLSLQNGSSIQAASAIAGELETQGGGIFVNASSSVSLADQSRMIAGSFGGSGSSGDIMIMTKQLSLQNGSAIAAQTSNSTGNGGNITINASESVTLNTGSIIATGSSNQGGNSGSIFMTTPQLLLQEQSSIAARTENSAGQGGDITIDSNTITLTGASNIFADSINQGGDAGNILITTHQLWMQDGSTISTSIDQSAGNGGNLTINASDSIVLNEKSRILVGVFGQSSGDGGDLSIHASNAILLSGQSEILAGVFGQSSGNSGDTLITTGFLSLQEGSQILATTAQGSSGDGGDITLAVSGSIHLDGASTIGTGSFTPLDQTLIATGNSGNISITANQLLLQNGSSIFSTTQKSTGTGGNITITVADSITLLSNSQIATGSVQGSGASGDIVITTGALTLLDGSDIAAGTRSSSGDGGDITIDATAILLSGMGADGASSGIFSRSLEGSSGNAGMIQISTQQLSVQDGATIETSSTGSGNAGDIKLTADVILLDDGSLSASANQAGGGDIRIKAREITLTNNSLISTSVLSSDSTSGGGNITILSDQLIALDNSDILATATLGPGGNITIDADVFLADIYADGGGTPAIATDFATLRNNGRVDISASSQANVNGEVSFPELSLQAEILEDVKLNFINSEQLVADSCLSPQRTDRDQSRFTVSGAGGLAQTPYELVVLSYTTSKVEPIAQPLRPLRTPLSSASHLIQKEPPFKWALGDSIQEANMLFKTSNGRMLLGQAPAALPMVSDLVCD